MRQARPLGYSWLQYNFKVIELRGTVCCEVVHLRRAMCPLSVCSRSDPTPKIPRRCSLVLPRPADRRTSPRASRDTVKFGTQTYMFNPQSTVANTLSLSQFTNFQRALPPTLRLSTLATPICCRCRMARASSSVAALFDSTCNYSSSGWQDIVQYVNTEYYSTPPVIVVSSSN